MHEVLLEKKNIFPLNKYIIPLRVYEIQVANDFETYINENKTILSLYCTSCVSFNPSNAWLA